MCSMLNQVETVIMLLYLPDTGANNLLDVNKNDAFKSNISFKFTLWRKVDQKVFVNRF